MCWMQIIYKSASTNSRQFGELYISYCALALLYNELLLRKSLKSD